MKVSKTLKWEAAHRLVHGYPGNCSQLHGHSYVATVVLRSKTASLNKFGFVKDFNDIKLLKQWVDTNWDHGTLVSSDDQLLLAWLVDNKQRFYIINHNPTAETIGLELYKTAKRLLDDDFSEVCEIRINETCTSEAVVTNLDVLTPSQEVVCG